MPPLDAGVEQSDASWRDAGWLDGTDAGHRDAGQTDAGWPDAGLRDAGPRADASVPDAGQPIRLSVQRLRVDAGVELLILQAPGRLATYAQWMPVRLSDGGASPVMVFARPYDGVPWSPDPLDVRWAQRGAGVFPDVDGPNPGVMPTSVSYTPVSVEAELLESRRYHAHGISTLAVYARFYAGGSIQNDVDDMVTGLEFLALEPGVDRARIGISGSSWGGFLALHGSAAAPPEATPCVAVAGAPVADFDAEWTFATSTVPGRVSANTQRDFTRFFDPYLRRIAAATGGPPMLGDFSRFNLDAVARGLRTKVLITHEDWDTLVTFTASEALAGRRPDVVRPLWLRHAGPPPSWDALGITHGPLLEQFGGGTWPFHWAHLLLALSAERDVEVPYDMRSLTALLEHARDASRLGVRHDELAPLLLLLSDARVTLFEQTTGARAPGAVVVSGVLNATWGLSTSSHTVGAALDAGLPQ